MRHEGKGGVEGQLKCEPLIRMKYCGTDQLLPHDRAGRRHVLKVRMQVAGLNLHMSIGHRLNLGNLYLHTELIRLPDIFIFIFYLITRCWP